jgi:hypothetical protein
LPLKTSVLSRIAGLSLKRVAGQGECHDRRSIALTLRRYQRNPVAVETPRERRFRTDGDREDGDDQCFNLPHSKSPGSFHF